MAAGWHTCVPTTRVNVVHAAKGAPTLTLILTLIVALTRTLIGLL